MSDKKQRNEPMEREDTIRDLDVPEEQADGVKGGSMMDAFLKIDGFKAKPKDPASGGSS